MLVRLSHADDFGVLKRGGEGRNNNIITVLLPSPKRERESGVAVVAQPTLPPNELNGLFSPSSSSLLSNERDSVSSPLFSLRSLSTTAFSLSLSFHPLSPSPTRRERRNLVAPPCSHAARRRRRRSCLAEQFVKLIRPKDSPGIFPSWPSSPFPSPAATAPSPPKHPPSSLLCCSLRWDEGGRGGRGGRGGGSLSPSFFFSPAREEKKKSREERKGEMEKRKKPSLPRAEVSSFPPVEMDAKKLVSILQSTAFCLQFLCIG